jgi:hypothetical protein
MPANNWGRLERCAWARRGDCPDRLIFLWVALKSRFRISIIYTLHTHKTAALATTVSNKSSQFFPSVDLGARREGLLYTGARELTKKMTKSDKRHFNFLRSEIVSRFRLKSEKVGTAAAPGRSSRHTQVIISLGFSFQKCEDQKKMQHTSVSKRPLRARIDLADCVLLKAMCD